MATDINQITLTGRLVSDVETKDFNDSCLITGSLATNRSVKRDGEWKEEASFFNFKLWTRQGKQKDFYESVLKKGASITVNGEMVQERWESNGEKKSRYVIDAVRVITPSKGNSDNNNASVGKANSNGSVPDVGSDFPEDIPF